MLDVTSPIEYSRVDIDYDHHRNKPIDQEIEICQINLNYGGLRGITANLYLHVNRIQTEWSRNNLLSEHGIKRWTPIESNITTICRDLLNIVSR